MDDAKKPFMKFLVERMPAESSPIEGYEAPLNFPNETVFHKSVFEDAIKWFEKFPECCDPHRDMAAEGRVKKGDYEGLPKKILDCLSFTEHFITTRIDTPNWFAEITDYIDYVRWNFGSLEIGLHKYDQYLKHFIEGSKNIIPELKRQRLLEYIEDCNKPINPDMALENDLEIIYDTLQKWVKTFPFELPYFKGLKVQFEGKIPVFKEPARLNPYTGMKKGKGWTRTELVDVLGVITKRLLDGVQADKMLKEGQILDISKHRLEIANESLRVGTAKLLGDYSKGELRYVTTLKNWLDLQKTYFKEVVDIIGKQPAKLSSNTGLSPKVWALYYIYRQENGSHPHFPHGQKGREIKRIALEHSVDAKNFEVAYNQYNSSKNRLLKVRLPDLEKAVELLIDFPDAQKAAKDELRTLKARNE